MPYDDEDPDYPEYYKGQVHALADVDKMPEGLKITNRANNVIFDTAWIARVDYDEQEFHDDEYDKEEEETKTTTMMIMKITTTKRTRMN
jgi:hypothetical protein